MPIKEFIIAEDIDVPVFESMVQGLYKVLDMLSRGEIPSKEYTADDLAGLCGSLVRKQRRADENIERARNIAGSWCVSPSLNGMHKDAWVDFVQAPTCLGLSILNLVKIRHGNIAAAVPGTDEAMRNGMDFLGKTGISGHGYEKWDNIIESLEILHTGKVLEFIFDNRDFSPPFYQAMADLKARIIKKLNTGDTCEGFYRKDYRDLYEEILKTVFGEGPKPNLTAEREGRQSHV